MAKPILHQFSESMAKGDAVSDSVIQLRTWLRELGFESDIYAVHFPDEFIGDVKAAVTYRRSSAETHIIYHHAAGATVVDQLVTLGLPLILIYHNITKPEFFASSNPALAKMLTKGRDQMPLLRQHTALALGDSHYNEQELGEFGFEQTGVLPIVLDPSFYDYPTNEPLAARVTARGPHVLFVGRIAPNKRQEDLVKLIYHYRKIRPNAHLTLVGSAQLRGYQVWLNEFINNEELDDAVTITGHVSLQDMVTYFRSADLFVSMSEHEGFGKPLIESMYHDLPVLAYSSTAVPFTLGGSGVLFHDKNFEALAELVDILIHDEPMRASIIAKQRQRLEAFLEPTVKAQFADYLRQLALM